MVYQPRCESFSCGWLAGDTIGSGRHVSAAGGGFSAEFDGRGLGTVRQLEVV